MLGLVAPWAGGEPEIGDEELEDVWFARAEVEAAVAGHGALRLPPPLVIARRLVEVSGADDPPKRLTLVGE